MADTELAVATRNLTKRFGALTAVDRLDLAIRPGQAFGLVGPDGAGKTTVLRLLVGALAPSEGDVFVLGLDLAHHLVAIRPRIGYLAQQFSLYRDLTVAENLAFFAEVYGVPRAVFAERERELLAFARLAEHRHRSAGQLSGGMRQKLALACALIHAPQVLFLDEPTTGVDPISRREFWTMLASLLRRGTTIVITTPYMDEAERCATVALLYGGRLVACAAPAALRTLFRGELVELSGPEASGRALQALVRGWPEAGETTVLGNALHVQVDAAAAAIPRFHERLATAGHGDVRLRLVTPSLEDVLVSVIRSEQP